MPRRLPSDENSYRLTMADYSQVRDGRYFLHSDEDNSLKNENSPEKILENEEEEYPFEQEGDKTDKWLKNKTRI